MANAALIAAAPELLDALESIVTKLRGWPMPGMRDEFDAAIAAIAKAKSKASAAALEDKLEEALALGFQSVEQCEKHQEWLDRMAEHKAECAAAVENANDGVIDMRAVKTW